MLALKCLSIYQLAVRTLDDLNSAVLTALQVEGLYDGSLSAKTYRLDVAAVGVSVANPPIGHFQSLYRGMPLLRRSKALPSADSNKKGRLGSRPVFFL